MKQTIDIKQLTELVYDLGWDYERMTSGGRDIYDELCEILGIDIAYEIR